MWRAGLLSYILSHNDGIPYTVHLHSGPTASDPDPILHKIYRGRVKTLREFGAFVSLEGVDGHREGMVHVSMMPNTGGARIQHSNEAVERGQAVWVKVMSLVGTKCGLSMKDVDQKTGEDLSPHLKVGDAPAGPGGRPFVPTGSNAMGVGATGPSTNGEAPIDPMAMGKRKTRLTSPELWEIKQLIAAGVMDPSQMPDFDEESGVLKPEDQEIEQELDIELREEEPAFLKGQTSRALNLSPVKVIKIPDGSLNRAAMAAVDLAKERKELRNQQEEQAAAAPPAGAASVSEGWNDPMAKPQDRLAAIDLRDSARIAAEPEWKKKMFGTETSFGKRTDLSMKEQRESLPVFKLRDALISAVRENQILVVIGDTGMFERWREIEK